MLNIFNNIVIQILIQIRFVIIVFLSMFYELVGQHNYLSQAWIIV